MKVAVYVGSFDPMTLGHWDILQRAGQQYDKVVLVIAYNPAKKGGLFNGMERRGICAEIVADNTGLHISEVFRYTDDPVKESDPKFTVMLMDKGLAVNVAKNLGATALIRGLRSITDFEAELQMALTNRVLAPDIETVFFITAPEHLYVSSSTVREIASLDGPLDKFVTTKTAEHLRAKFHDR